MHHVYSMCILGVCVCVWLARSPRLVGLGVAEGHGSVHPSAAAGHKDGERETEREMIRLLAVHAARGGWLNTTAGVTN